MDQVTFLDWLIKSLFTLALAFSGLVVCIGACIVSGILLIQDRLG